MKHVYKPGDKVRIVADGCYHNLKMGSVVTLRKLTEQPRICNRYPADTPTWWTQEHDCYIAEPDFVELVGKEVAMAQDKVTITPNTNNSIARIRAALIMAEKILQSFESESSCVEVDSLYSDRTGKAIMKGRDSKTGTQFEIEISTKQKH